MHQETEAAIFFFCLTPILQKQFQVEAKSEDVIVMHVLCEPICFPAACGSTSDAYQSIYRMYLEFGILLHMANVISGSIDTETLLDHTLPYLISQSMNKYVHFYKVENPFIYTI